tara:strand:+ start:247 stop:969 length:723 start_codon:yes stop_codon:yes gene_type:complete
MKIHGTAKGGALSKKDFGVAFSTGGGGFSPDDVDDLGCWYDASDSTTVTKDGSDRVSQWDDKKGSADLTQSTSGSQPLLVEGDLNDLDVINFTNDRDMAVTSTSASQPTTWYLVATAPAATGTTRRPLTCGTQQFFTSATSNRFSIYAGEQLNFTATLGTTQFYVWTLRFNGASSDLLVDDTSKVSGDAGTGTINGTLNIAGAFGNYSNNKFAEILRYDSDVSSDDNDSIITYLNDKWGL